jgi:enoyl-CoA hydratase
MPHPHLTVETSPDGYRWLRLSRPERRNALDVSLLRAVTDALAFEPEAPVVLGSTDPRVFCAGADLTISEAERAAVSDLIYDCCETIVTRPGPVMAVGGLLDRMQAERSANRSAWARAIPVPPGP